jgi:hypothetical protein
VPPISRNHAISSLLVSVDVPDPEAVDADPSWAARAITRGSSCKTYHRMRYSSGEDQIIHAKI